MDPEIPCQNLCYPAIKLNPQLERHTLLSQDRQRNYSGIAKSIKPARVNSMGDYRVFSEISWLCNFYLHQEAKNRGLSWF